MKFRDLRWWHLIADVDAGQVSKFASLDILSQIATTNLHTYSAYANFISVTGPAKTHILHSFTQNPDHSSSRIDF